MLRPREPVVEILPPEVFPDEFVRAEGDDADDGAEVEGEDAVFGVLGEHAIERRGHAKAALQSGGGSPNRRLSSSKKHRTDLPFLTS